MALETGNFISDLDITNPTATDLKSQGDDHLRLIKKVIRGTFVNLNAAVRATPEQLNLIADGAYTAAGLNGNWAQLPAGTRMPFAQAAAPTGWVQDVSDNANNRMLRVVSTAGGGVAGTHSPILNNVVPSHTHTYSGTSGGHNTDHAHLVSANTGGMSANANHSHGITDAGHSHTQDGSIGGTFAYSGGGGNAGVGTPLMADASTSNVGTGISINWSNTDHGHYFSVWSGGVNTDHNHGYSGTTTGGGSSATNWSPRYIDMIVCAKS